MLNIINLIPHHLGENHTSSIPFVHDLNSHFDSMRVLRNAKENESKRLIDVGPTSYISFIIEGERNELVENDISRYYFVDER